jgi:hypothetical protein
VVSQLRRLLLVRCFQSFANGVPSGLRAPESDSCVASCVCLMNRNLKLQGCLQNPQTLCKSFIVSQLPESCPILGKAASSGTELWCSWKPLGTLWKDFSPIFPVPGLSPGRKLAEDQFYIHIFLSFSKLSESRFKNLSLGLSMLWKPDCDCSGESLRAAMGTLWR